MPASGSETISMLVCSALKTYTNYSIAQKQKIADLQCPENIAATTFSVLLKLRHPQHERNGCHGLHCLRHRK